MTWTSILLFLFSTIHPGNCIGLELIATSRTSYLHKYTGYIDVVPMHLEIPKELRFASFKFEADEEQMSFLGCSPRDVLLYVKRAGLPVLILDGSKIPKSVQNITRIEPTLIQLKSDKKSIYFNLTNPIPGCYYIAATLPYSDPKHQAIQPPGLTPECYAFIETRLYVEKEPEIQQILEGTATVANATTIYKFYAPDIVSHAILIVEKVDFETTNTTLVVTVQARALPGEASNSGKLAIHQQDGGGSLPFRTLPGHWHYLRLDFGSSNRSVASFNLKFFFDDFGNEIESKSLQIRRDSIENVLPYQQYDLVRESSTDSFTFSFELPKTNESATNLAINVTSAEFVQLKFKISPHSDIGGALMFTIAFRPRVNRQKRLIEPEPPDHTIIACLHHESSDLPTYPHFCAASPAPILLNATKTNASIAVPFPEAGNWYATFKLYCGACVPCNNCTRKCRARFDDCVKDCETQCLDSGACFNCSAACKSEVIARPGCAACDCAAGCEDRGAKVCNSSVIFDVSSVPCVGHCGTNGRCMFVVSDGVVYTSCVCANNYRGWDCGDNSNATPYAMVLLELVLLVVSNLGFLPAVYVAYERQYYVEAICYFSICFFSSFYHACDAGENIVSFCLAQLQALQFADFYCALLALWVTLIAIADLVAFWPTLCQISGAIVCSFITSINKRAAWVFVVPGVGGALIVGISWYLKWRKVRQLFLRRKYLCVNLPVGLVVGGVGIAIYSFLETANNYKYLHSMWHVIMAATVVILLPNPDTFQPETML